MLEVAGIHTYYGRAEILADVSFEVAAGEVVALLGRNGAGKSTTLKSIMGLVRPKRGKVVFDGEPVTHLQPFRICQRGLGYVPEDRRIFARLTVTENLDVARQPARSSVPAWSPERLFELFPNLAERRNEWASALSGGERQMLTVARTLMGNPRAILLDEPSEGLAPVIVEQMATAVEELKAEGVTILLSEQNLYFAGRVADRVVIIEKGRIRHSATMKEALADESVHAAYLTA